MSKARDIADLDFNSPDIDGGNIDGAVIGATTRANGDFLAISASSTLTVANTNGYGTIEVGGSSGAFIDLKRPSSDDYDMRIVTDGGTGGRIDANGNIQINATNEAVFNENSADVDFRVESNGNANMIFVNAGSDVVSFGTTDTFPGDGDTSTGAAISASGSAAFSRDGFRVVSINRNNSDGTLIEFNKDGSEKGNIGLGSGNAYFSSTEFGIKPTSIGLLSTNTTGGAQNNLYDIGSNSYRWKDLYLSGTATVGGLTVDGDPALNGNVTITNTGTGAAAGPYLTLDRNSSSPADSDLLGILSFRGRDDGANVTDYASIFAQIADVSDGTEDGILNIKTMLAGTNVRRIDLGTSETVFNEDSKDLNFRVESNGNTHALFVDGANNRVGILGVPTVAFHVHGTSNDSPSESTAYVQFEGSGGNGLAFGTGAASLNYSSWIQAGYVQNFGAAKYNLALQPLGANVLVGESNNNNGTYGKLNVLAPASTNWGNIAESALNIRQPNNTSYHGQIVFSNSAGGAYGYAAIGCDMTNGVGIGLGDLVFATKSQGTDAVALERLRVLSSGGLTFNGDTATANALDDYEEGTWTPQLRTNAQALTQSWAYLNGAYTKVGRAVHVHFGGLLSGLSGTGGGELRIYGLPFASATTGGYQEPAHQLFIGNQPTAEDSYTVYAFVHSGQAYLGTRELTGGDDVFESNKIDSNTFFKFQMTYYV